MKQKYPLLAFASIFLFTAVANAAEGFTASRPSLSGHVLFGGGDEYLNINPYGLGIGARAGYTLRQGIYLGALLDFFFGGSNGAVVGEASASTWLLQAEGGYDFAPTRSVVLRPKVSLGATSGHRKGCVDAPVLGNQCASDSSSDLSFALGVEGVFELNGFYLAPELRYNVVDSSNDWSALVIGLGAGTTF